MPHRRYPAASSAQTCTFPLGEGSSETAKCIAEKNQKKWDAYRAEHYQITGKEQVITILNTHAHMLGKTIGCFPHSGQNMSHNISLSILRCPKDTVRQAERSVLSKPTPILSSVPDDIPNIANLMCLKSAASAPGPIHVLGWWHKGTFWFFIS